MALHPLSAWFRTVAGVLALAALTGCNTWLEPGAIIGATTFFPIEIIQRTYGDVVASVITGRDCSIVRLDKQESWCKERETTYAMPYCTRSLGVVDCWVDPRQLRPIPPQVADAPSLTMQQEVNRRQTWLQHQAGF